MAVDVNAGLCTFTDLRDHQGEEYLVGSRELARLLHSKNDVQGAKDVIEQAVNKFPDVAHTGGSDFFKYVFFIFYFSFLFTIDKFT